MARGIKFRTHLTQDFLQNLEQAEDYLENALEEGNLEFLQAVIEDLQKAGYRIFKVTKNKSNLIEEQDSLNNFDIKLKQQVLEVKS